MSFEVPEFLNLNYFLIKKMSLLPTTSIDLFYFVKATVCMYINYIKFSHSLYMIMDQDNTRMDLENMNLFKIQAVNKPRYKKRKKNRARPRGPAHRCPPGGTTRMLPIFNLLVSFMIRIQKESRSLVCFWSLSVIPLKLIIDIQSL